MSFDLDSQAEILKLQRELARAKSQCSSLKAANDHLLKELEISDRRCDFITSIDSPIPKETLKATKASGTATAVLVLSDWHWEENVDPTTINHLNEYSPAIARRRAARIASKSVMVLDTLRRLAKVDELVIALLGDFMTGYIHEELEESNHLSPVETILEVQDALWTLMRTVRKESGIKRVVVPTAIGNHGRTTKKKRVSTGHRNSYEWLMYQQMARLGDGFDWRVGNGYFNWLDVQGHACRFHHGDSIRYAGGVGGITIPVNKALAQWDKTRQAKLDFFGHYHQAMTHNRWVSNASLIGYNAYAQNVCKAEFEPPSQTLALVSRERGLIAALKVFAE